MTIDRIEKEIIKAIRIEDKQIMFLTQEDKRYLKSLENFTKKLFKEYREGKWKTNNKKLKINYTKNLQR